MASVPLQDALDGGEEVIFDDGQAVAVQIEEPVLDADEVVSMPADVRNFMVSADIQEQDCSGLRKATGEVRGGSNVRNLT